MLAPRALSVPVVCARRLQRALPKDNLSRLGSSHLLQAPILTTQTFVPTLPTASRMMTENAACSESMGTDKEISRRGRPKCFGA